ncbi:MAG: CHRD domain-containing protein [Acidimicrobiia bacterium]
MKRFSVLMVILALATMGTAPALAANRNFATHLEGGNEVPAVSTSGQGQAIFQVAEDGASIDYKLIVANIEDVTMSHIHIGGAGVNGPVTVFLFGPNLAGVDVNGVLAQGTITASDLIGPLAGQPLSALIEAMESGNAYVNVHTLDNPGGEIRGQLG